MLKLHAIIGRNTETISLLIMALLQDTYSAIGTDTFVEFMKGLSNDKLTNDQVVMLRSKATKVNIEIDKVGDEDMTWLSCDFRGHKGYPGGEFSEDLMKIGVWVKNDVLLYMLATMGPQIEEAKKELQRTIESGNAE